MMYNPDSSFNSHCVGTQFKYALFPKTCHISGKRIWLEKAYRQTAMWTGPDDPVFEYRWYDKNEFLAARLKGLL